MARDHAERTHHTLLLLLLGFIAFLFHQCTLSEARRVKRATARPIPIPLPLPLPTAPAAHAPLIMLSTMDGTISAFDASTGELRFSYTDSSPAVQSWYATGHPEYVPSVDGLLYRIDHETGEAHVVEGKFISRSRASSLSNALPAGAHDAADAVVLTNQNSSVIFIDIHTGQILRRTDFSDEPRETTSLAHSDSIVIVQRTSVAVRILETRSFRELANASIVHTEPRFWQRGKCVASPNPVFDEFVAYTTDTRDRVIVRNIRTGNVIWSKDVATPVVEVHGLGGVRVAGSVADADAIADLPQALPQRPSSALADIDPTIQQNVVVIEKDKYTFAMLPSVNSDSYPIAPAASFHKKSSAASEQTVREYAIANKRHPSSLGDDDKILAISRTPVKADFDTDAKDAIQRSSHSADEALDFRPHHVGLVVALLLLVGGTGYIVGSRPRRRRQSVARTNVPKRRRTNIGENGRHTTMADHNGPMADITDYETDFEDDAMQAGKTLILPPATRPVLTRDGTQMESSTGSNGSTGGFVCNRSESGWMTVGCLQVSSNVLGVGSHGTIVYEGKMMPGERKVAVKRLLRQFYESARKEISLLVELDEASPHVVRYFAMEEDSEFIYLALELCAYSLAECITGRLPPVPPTEYSKGPPPPFTSRALRQLLQGLADLHRVGVVHRDVKPQNVLITRSNTGVGDVKLADVGLALRLAENRSSYTAVTNAGGGIGTTGWRAPEVLSGGRQTKAVDIFAVGCMVSSILTGGDHPFGKPIFGRDGNIASGKPSLETLDSLDLPEAADIVRKMISTSSADRPTAEEALQHPFFWTDATKLSFLVDISDRLYDLRHNAVRYTENLDRYGLARRYCSDWQILMDMDLLSSLGRDYENTASGLLRVIRNKRNHYSELPLHIQRKLGPIPEDRGDGEESDSNRDGDCNFLTYFTRKVPQLLMCVYRYALENPALTDQPHFERYGMWPGHREEESLEIHPLVLMRRDAMSTSRDSSIRTRPSGSADADDVMENENSDDFRRTYHRHELVDIQGKCEEVGFDVKRRLILFELYQPAAFKRYEKRLATNDFSDSDYPAEERPKPLPPDTEVHYGHASRENGTPPGLPRIGGRKGPVMSPFGLRPNNGYTGGNGEEGGRGHNNTPYGYQMGLPSRRSGATTVGGIAPTISQFSGEERVVDFGALRRRS